MPPTLPAAIRTYARANLAINPRDPGARTIRLYDAAADWDSLVRLPSAAHVARYLVARHLADIGPAFRTADGLVIRRNGAIVPLTADELTAITTDLLAAIPDRVTGMRELSEADLFRGLRTFTRNASDADVGDYVTAVALAVPATLKRVPTPKVKSAAAERPTPKTTAERSAKYRASRADDERATVEAFLRWLASDYEPGATVARSELLDELATFIDEATRAHERERDDHDDALGAWEYRAREAARQRQDFDTPAPTDPWPIVAARDGYPLNPVTVGRNRAIALLIELGADEVRRADGRYHRVPDAKNPTTREDAPVNPDRLHELADATERAADATERLVAATRELLDLQRERLTIGDHVGALTAQRERLGLVIDAADRFTRRAA